MEKLDIEKFSPKKAELMTLVDKCKGLKIESVTDKEGYALVDEHRKMLTKSRTDIQRTGKMMRADAITFQKAVLATEKELIGIIEPTEKELRSKQHAIDEERTKIARKAVLPVRQRELEAIGIKVDDDFLLLMDDNKWKGFFNDKKEEYLEEQERIANKKREEEEAKLQAEKDKIEKEKQKIKEEKRIEKARAEAKKEAEEKAEAKQKQKENNEKYQKFLEKNGYNEKTKNDFYLQTVGAVTTIYKKLDEIIIN